MKEKTQAQIDAQARWNRIGAGQKRLQEAKISGAARKQREWHTEHYDEHDKLVMRTKSRIKAGKAIE